MTPKPKTALQLRLEAFEELHAQTEPKIHAFVPETERFARLRKEAAALERKYTKKRLKFVERLRPTRRPPLFGLLVGVKDMFHADGFETRAGSRLPARDLRGPEAASVTALKNAGALVAGKTVTTEFAYFAPGPTRNPHNTEHTPGGSSSGSAAAVAAGLVDLALGTQTIGSIIRPASFCGVAGFKPSFGRISTAGVINLAPSLDHVGLFAQDVELLRRSAAVLCKDWKPSNAEGKPYLAAQSGAYMARADREMQAHFEGVLGKLEAAGYRIRRLPLFADIDELIERNQIIVAAEAARVHAGWYDAYKHLYHEKTAALIEKGQSISGKQLQDALEGLRRSRLNIETVMDLHGIDAFVSPSAPGAAPKGLGSTGDPVMNLPWTQAGVPALGLPSGANADGLPLGLQVTARFGRDEDLLAWGAGIESAMWSR